MEKTSSWLVPEGGHGIRTLPLACCLFHRCASGQVLMSALSCTVLESALTDLSWTYCQFSGLVIRLSHIQSNLIISLPVILPTSLLATVATGMIFFHVIYLVNSPPSRLALAN